MTTTFSKAPLVEIVAEFRWSQKPDVMLQSQQPAGIPAPLMAMNSSRFDEFFMRFGGEVYKEGFQRAERIVPAGFPLMLYQPVFRYRKSTDADGSALYQTGAGMFSAHAIPPYRSWDEFAPVVQAGIDALLNAREESEKALPFTSVSLRYIDAFRSELTGGRDAESFIRDVLGIAIGLPNGLSKLVAPGKKVKPMLQLSLPLANNMSMNVGIAEGIVNSETAIVMDTTVSTSVEVPAERNSAMDTLHSARSIIHEMFFDLTTTIQPLMQPSKKG